MSYTVLARKYRSQTFDDLVGQDAVARTLTKAIESNRIAHAFLFCGTRGTGKTSTARILARALNCEKSDKPTVKPCGKCNSCLAISRGDDIDVIEIDAASQTGVDNIRDLIANASLHPARCRFKVYIIDEVHMLSKGAFNALLKTLEEPPGHVKFILATTEPEKVLPTILSRCQRYDFRNIPTREIAAHLKGICKDEKVKADDDALLLIARSGAGSMRDALSLLDRLLSVGEKELSAEGVEQLLGMPRAQSIFELVQSIGEGDVKRTLEQAGKLVSSGLAPDTLVVSLADHLRNLLVLRTCGKDSDLVEAPGVSLDELSAQAGKFDPAALSQDIAILEELRSSLKRSGAGRALLDATMVRLALAEQFVNVADLLEGTAPQKKKPEVRGGERGEGSGVRPESKAPVPAPPAADEDDDALPAVGKVWANEGPSLSELLRQEEAKHPRTPDPVPSANVVPVDRSDLAAVMDRLCAAFTDHPGIISFLNSGTIRDISDSLAVIAFPQSQAVSATMLERAGKKERVQQALCELLGAPVGVKFEVDFAAQTAHEASAPNPVPAPSRPRVAAPAARPAQPAEPQQVRITPELREQLRNSDPLIAAIITELGGEIVKVE